MIEDALVRGAERAQLEAIWKAPVCIDPVRFLAWQFDVRQGRLKALRDNGRIPRNINDQWKRHCPWYAKEDESDGSREG